MSSPCMTPALGKNADFDDPDPTQAEADFTRLIQEWRQADEMVAEMAFDDTFDMRGQDFSPRMVYRLLRESLDGTTGR